MSNKLLRLWLISTIEIFVIEISNLTTSYTTEQRRRLNLSILASLRKLFSGGRGEICLPLLDHTTIWLLRSFWAEDMTKELTFGLWVSSFSSWLLEAHRFSQNIILILFKIFKKDKSTLMIKFGTNTISLPKILSTGCSRRKSKGWL